MGMCKCDNFIGNKKDWAVFLDPKNLRQTTKMEQFNKSARHPQGQKAPWEPYKALMDHLKTIQFKIIVFENLQYRKLTAN